MRAMGGDNRTRQSCAAQSIFLLQILASQTHHRRITVAHTKNPPTSLFGGWVSLPISHSAMAKSLAEVTGGAHHDGYKEHLCRSAQLERTIKVSVTTRLDPLRHPTSSP